MAVFTVQLGKLIDSGFDLELDNPDTYPIFDPAYRATLNRFIIDHFEFREIGQETPELFKRFLHRKLREIMPLYNDLYESQLIQFNPLHSTDSNITSSTSSTRDGVADETSSADSTNTATGRVLVSQTPQTQLTGNMDYAAGLTDNTQEGVQGTTGEANTISHDASLTEYTYHVAGYSGQNPSEAIIRFRQSLINVNLMVLHELEILFMGLWSVGR